MGEATRPRPSREDLCLITGASGFIGGRLAERLSQQGYPVRCLVRPSSDTTLLDRLDVQLVHGDLMELDALARAAEGARFVVHCAALVSDWATKEEIVRTNVEGTRNLLDVAAHASVQRFIHLSTTDVYGHPGGAEIDEAYVATRFSNWYSHTKSAAEAEVRGVERDRGLDTAILRPATVYGPGSSDVIGEIARAIRGRNMLLIDGGRAVAGLCYVENLLDLVTLVLSHEAASGQVFNVSDGLQITWRELTDDLAEGLGCAKVRWSLPYWLANVVGFSLEQGYRLLRRATGLSTAPLLSRQAVQVLGKSQDFSAHKAREMLGWEPRVGYRDGLQETLAWLRTTF